ncbi:MAG: hypothetical protein JWM87_243 [Candidatus Eremiobacteraeota bacterium]|nr:hypothetical protein [Candidatus Eremiobacteraeota bacterium]
MPAPIVQLGAVVMCSHAGTATPLVPSTRVLASGQPVITITSPWAVAGCALTPSGGPFCVTGQVIVGATRVLAGGMPVVVQTSTSVCVATGSPLIFVSAQLKAIAT